MSVASLGVLRALAASGPVIIAIDDVQWLDAPSARVMAFVVRRLGDAPIRILAALRVGAGGDPLALGQAGLAPSVQRMTIGPLRREAMARLLRDRTGRDLTHPVLLRLHRIAEGNPLFALEAARVLTGQGVRPAPGEPLPVPVDLQELLGARLAALPPSAADELLVVAAAARPTVDLIVAAAAPRDRAAAGFARAERAGIVQRAGERLGFTHPLLGSTVYAAATPQARRRVHRRLADLVVDPEERARHLALAASGPDPQVAQGRTDEAEALVDRLERPGRDRDRPWAIAAASRGRGLLAAARGDLPAARSALEHALVEHRRVRQPFELARTLLVQGEVERRAKQKRAARSALEQALALFETVGAPFWAQRARDDLARAGGAASWSSELTPTEQRIAQLVGEGKKNREVADALFISVKTVEANLSQIFHKLGVRSRTELARRIAAAHGQRVSPDSSPLHEA